MYTWHFSPNCWFLPVCTNQTSQLHTGTYCFPNFALTCITYCSCCAAYATFTSSLHLLLIAHFHSPCNSVTNMVRFCMFTCCCFALFFLHKLHITAVQLGAHLWHYVICTCASSYIFFINTHSPISHKWYMCRDRLYATLQVLFAWVQVNC